MASRRPRILFVAENLTLAQVVRLASLASNLDTARYEVHFAASDFDPLVFDAARFERWSIYSVDKVESLSKVERGERLYETQVLQRYVDEELSLIERVQPDLVVGDFRLTLPTSAEILGVPCAALINAYWSPYAVRDSFPLPDHPIVKLVGVERAQRYFPQALPRVFGYFASPINKLRKSRGLLPLNGLLEVLTRADFTLYPDVPDLCPTSSLPGNHSYLGHVGWSPKVDAPDVAALLNENLTLPLVYVTLGSSGLVSVMDAVLDALAELPVMGLVATADRVKLGRVPKNVVVTNYAPGDLAARKAAFVVTNGGASTSYQALAESKPVLGIPSNMDQYLAMTCIERAGAGRLVRSGSADKSSIRTAMSEVLSSAKLRDGASVLGRIFARYDCHARFQAFLDQVLNAPQSSPLAAS